MDFSQVKAITIPEGDVTRILSGTTVLWKKMGGLPSAYQEVEYIESDGSQYIDTGVIGKTGLHIVTEMGYATPTSTTTLFGSRDPRFFVTLYPSTTIDIGYNNDNSTGINAESRKIYNIDFDTSTSPARFGIDGSYITSNNQVDTNRNIYIFGCNRNGAVAALSESIFKSMTIADENGELLRNFVPCYRKSDGVAGLYDMVNNVFYTNAGTGSFTVGPEVFPLPSEYQQVEYIGSSGTQYIDTGVLATSGLSMDERMSYITIVNDSCFVGTRTTTARIYLHHTYPSKFAYGYGTYQSSNVEPQTGVIYSIHTDLNVGNQKMYVDGVEVKGGSSTDNIALNHTLYIFCMNRNGNAEFFTSGRLYELKLYKDGVKVRDFVPCYRKSDSVIGLYDLVSATFFTNSGSGTFSKGADVG